MGAAPRAWLGLPLQWASAIHHSGRHRQPRRCGTRPRAVRTAMPPCPAYLHHGARPTSRLRLTTDPYPPRTTTLNRVLRRLFPTLPLPDPSPASNPAHHVHTPPRLPPHRCHLDRQASPCLLLNPVVRRPSLYLCPCVLPRQSRAVLLKPEGTGTGITANPSHHQRACRRSLEARATFTGRAPRLRGRTTGLGSGVR
jgi:hypothetical protein